MLTLRRVGAALLASGVLLAACTTGDDPSPPVGLDPPQGADDPSDDVGGPQRGGTLRVGLSADPVSIDPRFVVDDAGELVVDALFDPLVRVGRDLRVHAAAAERWEVADEGRTFTFHLRESTFHDGTPVTAADFKRSFDRIADGTAEPRSFLAYLLEPVVGARVAQERGGGLEGVEVVGDRTLVIRLDAPHPDFLLTLADPSLAPLPAAADEDLEAFALQPIGNGPFAMAESRELGAFLRLTRFADHPQPPLLDEVVLTVYLDDPGNDLQWEHLEDGMLHVAEVVPERFADAAESYGTSLDGYTGPGLLRGITATVYLYAFDVSEPPFDDVRIRQAMSLALDREALASEVLAGARVPATAIVPPPVPGAQAGACGMCRHDPEAAAALLREVAEEAAAEQGVDDPDEALAELLGRVTLAFNRGPTHAAIAERMADDLEAALGIEVDLVSRDLQQFVREVRTGELKVFRLGWDANEPDLGAYLYPLLHSSQVGRDNLSRYESDEVDELLDAGRAAVSREQGIASYRAAERAVLAELPVLPLLWYQHALVVAPTVQELYASPFGTMSLAQVWLDPDAA